MPAFKPVEERFWEKTEKRGPYECWPWKGHFDKDGYGLLDVGRSCKGAHRVAWELVRGPIPPKMYVCHHCDNPPCVNPKHLYIGSGSDNMRDMWKRKRHTLGKRSKNGRFA